MSGCGPMASLMAASLPCNSSRIAASFATGVEEFPGPLGIGAGDGDEQAAVITVAHTGVAALPEEMLKLRREGVELGEEKASSSFGVFGGDQIGMFVGQVAILGRSEEALGAEEIVVQNRQSRKRPQVSRKKISTSRSFSAAQEGSEIWKLRRSPPLPPARCARA